VVAIVGVVGVVGFFGNNLGPAVDGLGWLRDVSPFHYYPAGAPLRNGLQLADAVLLAIASVALVVAAGLRFDRRDIAVQGATHPWRPSRGRFSRPMLPAVELLPLLSWTASRLECRCRASQDDGVREGLPTGTVTFLFTDIEGSTRLLQALGRGYPDLLNRHTAILRQAVAGHEGVEFGTEGDAFFAVFPSAVHAVEAAVAAQRSLAGEPWPTGHRVAVRMGLHTGEGVMGADGYVGLDVHRAARVADAAHGGQVLVSDGTRALVAGALPADATLRDLGVHRLKDINRPEHLYQLVIPDLPDDFPPIRTIDARQTNLPAERTSFVGREREIAELLDILREARLLTLTGPGGTGKTRLAVKVAAQLLDSYTEGVYFVDLSSITDHRFVPAAVAQALRLREQPGRRPLETLIDHLRGLHLLLVLDNLEHLLEASETVGTLLDAAPRLTILTTSRIPLHIAGEREFPLPPLSLPDAGDTGDPVTFGQQEAVRLFVDRATSVRPGFRLTSENAEAIGQIVIRLDGLPLAIELAAGRMKLLEPDEILERLGARLDLLIGGARDLPPRQRTLRAAIEWSYDLLEPDAQRLFARLAAFSGGWTLDAAEAVCAPGLGSSVLDGLGVLLDHSLLRVSDAAGGTRLMMLDTIREFAAERLVASGEADDVRRRHAEFYLHLAEDRSSATAEGARWPARSLEVERDNVRAALRWSLDADEPQIGLRIAAAIWPVWPRRDLAEGRAWLERLLALPASRRRDAGRARALTSLGAIALYQGDGEAGRAALEEAVAIARELRDARLLAYVINPLEVSLRAAGDLDAAEAVLAEAVASADAAGETATATALRGRIGFIQVFRGNPDAAIGPLREAVAAVREAGENSNLVWYMASLGTAEVIAGDLTAAKQDFRELLAMSYAATDQMALGAAIIGLGFVASGEGRHERLARLWGVNARVRREAGGGPLRAIRDRLGDPEGAARQALGDAAFEQRRSEGEAMSIDEGVAYALSPDDLGHDTTKEERADV
jgi:predicted ATPase/class 3 adenylate cyclase